LSLDKLSIDKPTRTKVADYIEKAIEESKKEGAGEEGSVLKSDSAAPSKVRELFPLSNSRAHLLIVLWQSGTPEATVDQDIYSDQQPDLNMDMSQMLVDQIPQLQAQISQISQALQNPNLPTHVRRQTEMQHQQLQIQLSQAQALSAALAVASFQQQQQQQAAAAQSVANMGFPAMGGFQQQMSWNQYAGQQQQGDSAYQRLPINNRRRNLKRERPSDFFETTAPDGSKVPRYWE
jgi:protein MPE1